jgi:peptide/nickel transport system substrate-binding protein
VETPTKIVYKLRQGIKFQNKAPANGREVTSADWVAAFLRMSRISNQGAYLFPPNQITAPDKYTVVVQLLKPDYDTVRKLSKFFFVYPPEAVGANDKVTWQNTIGTGPFILSDYVSGSSVTLTRNPNYWRNDPLHPNNTLPYLNKVKVLYITDVATRLAAMRSGQIDRMGDVAPADADELKKTNPSVLQLAGAGNLRTVYFRIDLKPFSDIRVRQALHMAIDLQGMQKDYFGGNAILPSAPISYGPWWTPLDKLPADIKDVFIYNPTKAKDLLTQAGYPNGFNTSMIVDMAPDIKPQAEIVKSYWDAIGVKTNLIIPASGAAFDSTSQSRKYEIGIFSTNGAPDQLFGKKMIPNGQQTYFWGLGPDGAPAWRDETIIAKQDAILATLDPAKQVALMSDLNLYVMRQVFGVGLPIAPVYTVWQARLHGYNGEAAVGINKGVDGMWGYAWVTDGK